MVLPITVSNCTVTLFICCTLPLVVQCHLEAVLTQWGSYMVIRKLYLLHIRFHTSQWFVVNYFWSSNSRTNLKSREKTRFVIIWIQYARIGKDLFATLPLLRHVGNEVWSQAWTVCICLALNFDWPFSIVDSTENNILLYCKQHRHSNYVQGL